MDARARVMLPAMQPPRRTRLALLASLALHVGVLAWMCVGDASNPTAPLASQPDPAAPSGLVWLSDPPPAPAAPQPPAPTAPKPAPAPRVRRAEKQPAAQDLAQAPQESPQGAPSDPAIPETPPALRGSQRARGLHPAPHAGSRCSPSAVGPNPPSRARRERPPRPHPPQRRPARTRRGRARGVSSRRGPAEGAGVGGRGRRVGTRRQRVVRRLLLGARQGAREGGRLCARTLEQPGARSAQGLERRREPLWQHRHSLPRRRGRGGAAGARHPLAARADLAARLQQEGRRTRRSASAIGSWRTPSRATSRSGR